MCDTWSLLGYTGCLKTAKGDNDNAILVMKQIKEGGQDRFGHRCRVASQKLLGPGSGLLYTSNSAVDRWNQDQDRIPLRTDISEQSWVKLSALIMVGNCDPKLQSDDCWSELIRFLSIAVESEIEKKKVMLVLRFSDSLDGFVSTSKEQNLSIHIPSYVYRRGSLIHTPTHCQTCGILS